MKNIKLWSRDIDKKILRIFRRFGVTIIVLLLLISSLLTIKEEILWQLGYYDDDYSSDGAAITDDATAETCNVLGIELHGEMVTYISPVNADTDGKLLEDQTASENIISTIQQAEKDNNIKAILLEVDSYGGSPTAAEEIANALRRAQKPTVALIRESGVSAAYWAATGADIIFASKNSDVGSIGVTMSYLDSSRQNQTEGLTYNQLSSGKFKDTGDPNKPLTSEEKELLFRDVKILLQNFVSAVADNRSLDIKKVESLADGSSMLGEAALKNGLIDKIGGMSEVDGYLKEKIGEEVETCW